MQMTFVGEASAATPTITSVTPSNVPVTGGDSIIITGLDFKFTPSCTSNTLSNWSFDESSGLTFPDSCNAYNATAFGTTLVAGKYSNARNFNGSGDYVATNLNLIKKDSAPFTISTWFKVPSTGGNASYDTLYSTGNCDGSYGLHSYSGSTRKLYFDKECVAGLITGNTTYTLDQWHQAVVVYNGSQARLYLDGQPDSAWTNVAAQQGAEADDFIGNIGTSASSPFKGAIDEVTVSKVVLSDSEILDQYNSGLSNISVGGNNATNINFLNSTTLTATTPAHTAGATDVIVTNYDGKSATLSGAFTYIAPPSITSITPNSSLKTGGDTVTITGSDFYGTPTVLFGGTNSASVTFVNSSTLSVVVPAHDAGIVDVTVINPGDQEATLANGFTYINSALTISSITPTSGPTAGGMNVTISGSNFIPPNSGGDSDWAVVSGKTLPGVLYGGSLVVIGDYIYLLGGYNSSNAAMNIIYSAPVSDPTTWTNTGKTLPIAMGRSSVAVIGDYIYLFGGYNGSSSVNSIYRASVSDPTTWTVVSGKTLPAGLYGSLLQIVNDTVYLFGGNTATNTVTNIIYSAPVSDPTTWTNTGKTLPGNLAHSAGANINGTLYLFNGATANGGGGGTNIIYSASVSDPTTWVNTGKTMPVSLSRESDQVFVVGNKIYLLGGWSTTSSSSANTILSANISDPTTWTVESATLPAVLSSHRVAIIDDYFYIFGGYITSATNAIYRAPLSHFRPNVYNKPWLTNWGTVVPYTDQSNVTIGGQQATNINFIDSNTITATTPANAAGVKDVTVTSYNGQLATLSGAFTYVEPPTITSITPTGLKTGGDTVTISGSNFVDTPDVTFGGIEATSVTRVDSSTLSVVIPAHNGGAVDVVVTNPDGQSATLANGVTYADLPPVISSINPDNGLPSGGTNVTIKGENFESAIDPNAVMLLHLDNNITDTIGRHTFSAGASSYSTSIKKFGSHSGYISSVISSSDNVSDFDFGTGDFTIDFWAYRAPSTNSVVFSVMKSSSTALFSIQYYYDKVYLYFNGAPYINTGVSHPVGSWVHNAYVRQGNTIKMYLNGNLAWTGTGYSASNFTGTSYISFSHASAATASYLDELRVSKGVARWTANFTPPTNSYTPIAIPAVTFDGVAATNIDFTDSTTLTATTPSHAAGPVNVVVTNPNGKAGTLNGGFTYRELAPVVTDVSPSYVSKTGGETVTITGANFFDGATVTFGGTSATSVTFVNSTTLTATVPVHEMGTYDVVVTNPDTQTGTLTDGITYREPPPTITSVTPLYVVRTGGDPVTITGTNFLETPTVTFGGTLATSVTFVNSTTLTAVVPAHTPGEVDVVVTNPDTQSATLTEGLTYTNLPPTITSITPNVGPSAGGTNVTIKGSNFTPNSDPYVKALFHFDNNMTDSTGRHTFTTGAPNSYSTSIKKFGTHSGFINSVMTSTDNLSDFDFGTGDFTIDFWAYRQSSNNQVIVYTIRKDGVNGVSIQYYNDTVHLYMDTNAYINTGVAHPVGSWVHNAFVRSGGTIKYFLNGSLIWTGTGYEATNFVEPAQLSMSYPGAPADSHIDELRISKGIARWTTNFTPPTEAYEYLASPTLTFDGLSATNINVVDSETITAITPAHAAGAVDVVVTSYDGGNAAITNGFSYYPDKYVFTVSPDSQNETEVGTFTVTAEDLNGNVLSAPGDITLSLSSTSISGFFARSLMEDLSTRWDYDSVVIPSGQSSATFYYKDNAKGTPTITATPPSEIGGTFAAKQITVTSKYRFLITGVTDPVKAGTSSSVTIQAVDYQGNPLHDYTGTVHFSSTESLAVLPQDFAITSNMLGGHTFVNGVGFGTQGEWCVTVTDTVDPNITGQQCNITVSAPNAGTISQVKFINSPQSFPIETYGTLTIQTQDSNGSPVNVTADKNIYIYTDSASGQFSTSALDGSWVSTQPFVVTIKANFSSTTFFYKDTTVGAHVLTARDDEGTGDDIGWVNDTQTETSGVGAAYRIGISGSSDPFTAGQVSSVQTATIYDQYGNAVTVSENQPINFAFNSASTQVSLNGSTYFSTPFGTIIPAGSNSLNFYIKDTKAGTLNMTVSDAMPADGNIGLVDAAKALSVSADTIDKFVFTTAPFSTIAGQISPQITVQAQDQYSNPVSVSQDTTVYLSGSNPEGIFSTDSSFSSTVNSITIPAGSSSASFYFKQTSYLASQTITASDSSTPDGTTGVIDATQAETINTGAISQLAFSSSSPSIVAGNETGVLNVETRNSYGVKVPTTSDLPVYFYTNSTGATKEFSSNASPSWSAITSSTISAGNSSINFYYKDTKAGTTAITVADDSTQGTDDGITNAALNVSILAGNYNGIVFTNNVYTVEAGQVAGPFTIMAVDSYNNPVTLSSPRNIYITDSGSSTTGSYSSSASGPFTQKSSWTGYVTIPSGQSSASFFYKNISAEPNVIQFNAEIDTAPGAESISQNLNLTWGTLNYIAVTFPGSTCTAGSACLLSVETRNAWNVPIRNTSTTTVDLSSTNLTGRFDTSSDGSFDGTITSFTFEPGLNEYGVANVWYKDTKAGSVTVTGSQTGITSGTATFVIGSQPGLGGLVITNSPQTLELGQKSGGIVIQLRDIYGNDSIANSDTVVNLSSSSSGGTFLNLGNNTITTTTILNGTGTATVYYKDITLGNPNITVSSGSYSTNQTETIIQGAPTKFSLESASNSLTAGMPSAVITLKSLNQYDQPVSVSSDLSVNLSSSNSTSGGFDTNSAGTFTATDVTILTGQSSTEFYYKDTTAGAVTITASKNGYTSRTFAFNTNAASLNNLVFINQARTIKAGENNSLTVQFRDQYGNVVVLGNPVDINLSSSDVANGKFASSASGPWNLSSINVPAGNSTATFYYSDTLVGMKTISVNSAGITGGTQDANIIGGDVHHFAFVTDPQIIPAQDASGAIIIQAYDVYNNPATMSFSIRLTLSSSSSQYQFSSSSSDWVAINHIDASSNVVNVYYKDWNLGTPTIIASPTGFSAIAQTETIVANSATKLMFLSGPQTIITNTPSGPISTFVSDAFGNQTTAPSNFTETISSSSATGQFSSDGMSGWNSTLNISVLAGESVKSFYYRDSTQGTYTLTVTPSISLTSSTQSMEVITGEISHINLSAQNSAIVGSPVEITLQTQTDSNMPAAVLNNIAIDLYKTGTTGEFSLSNTSWIPISSLTLSAGQYQKIFYFKETNSGTTTITADERISQGVSWTAGIKDISFSSGSFYKFGFAAKPSSVIAGDATSAYIVQAQDVYGNAVLMLADQSVYMYSSGTGNFALSSTGPWNATSATISSGTSTVDFYYRDNSTIGDETITVSDHVPIDSLDTGILNATAALTVYGQEATGIKFISSPQTITAGNYTGAIEIQAQRIDGSPAILEDDLTINLSSSPLSASALFVSTSGDPNSALTSATIKRGSNSVIVYYTNQKVGTFALNAVSGLFTDSQNVIVNAGSPNKFAFTTAAQTKSAGIESDQMRLELEDQYGNATNALSDLTINLTSTSANGLFSIQNGSSWSSTTSVSIASGSNDTFFYYKDTISGAQTITADETPSQGLSAGTQTFTVSAGSIQSIHFVTAARSLMAGQVSPQVAVSFYDTYGNVAIASATMNIYLYSDSAQGTFSLDSGFGSTITSLAVSAGESSKSFYYKDTFAGTPRVIVSDQPTLDDPTDLGITNAIQQETISWGSITQIRLTDTTPSIVAGQNTALHVQLQNQYGVKVNATNSTTVYLSSDSAQGKFSLSTDFSSTINSFVIAIGSGEQTIYYQETVSGTRTVTASDVSTPAESPDTGLSNGTVSVNINPSNIYRFSFTTTPKSLEAGQISSAITVQARDVYGNASPTASELPVYLTTTSSNGKFSLSTDFSSSNLITSGTITAGNSAMNFYYQDTSIGNPVVTASDVSPLDIPDTGILNATQTNAVVAGNVTKIAFSPSLGTVVAGGISDPITIKTQNQYSIDTPVLADTTLYLFSSSNKGTFSLNAGGPWTLTAVTLNAGQSSLQIYYRDGNTGTPTITISDTNVSSPDTLWTNAVGTMTVTVGTITQIAITSSAQTITARHSSAPMQVELRNQFGTAINTTTDATIYLRTNSIDGEFSTSSTGSWGISYITIPAGQSTGVFYYHDGNMGTPTITASDNLPPTPDTGWANATQQETIQIQVVDHLLVTNISDPHMQGNPSSIVVMAQDSENYVVTWYAGTIHFTASDSDAIIPGDYTFVPNIDKGIHTFKNGAAFLHSGEKTITATDTNNITGSQTQITVYGNTAGTTAKVKFIDITPPLVSGLNNASPMITVQIQDSNDQPTNAPSGGFPIRLVSTTGTGQFSTSPTGPWNSTGIFTIPEYLSFVNFYYKDSAVGNPTIIANDWVENADNSSISNDSLAVVVQGININVNKTITVTNNSHWPQVNSHIYTRESTKPGINYYGSANFDISLTDSSSGSPVACDLTLTWKNLSGSVVSTNLVPNVTNYTYSKSGLDDADLPNRVTEGQYTLDIQAVKTTNTDIVSTKSEAVPLSGWEIEVNYDSDNKILGASIPFTIRTWHNGLLADPDKFSIAWKDDGGNFVVPAHHPEITGSQYVLYKSDLTRTGTGQYSGTMKSDFIPQDMWGHTAFYLTTAIYSGSDDPNDYEIHRYDHPENVTRVIYAEDNHYDIFFKNNPALAPTNFNIEKMLTSTPPASETYDLKFTWTASDGATKYNLYRSRNKYATLFQDPCTIDQIKNSHRYGDTGSVAPFCETQIQQNVGTDDSSQWVKMAEVNSPTTEYTIPWSTIQSDLDNNVYYYILRAENNSGESGYSTMVFSLKKDFTVNADPYKNTYWISLPYHIGSYTNPNISQPYSHYELTQASDIVKEIEGSITGSAGNDKNRIINRVALWNPNTQNVSAFYMYSTAQHKWTASNFAINPGDGIYIQLSGNTENSTWTIVGHDEPSNLLLTVNTSPYKNTNWISIPYSTKYRTASDIVLDFEGALSGSASDEKNKKINRVALWNPNTQNVSAFYLYSTAQHKWTASNFTINPGDGIYVQLSGETQSLGWNQPLILNPYQ